MPLPSTDAVWRILDANAHRAMEGLRVVEEYWRFAIEDPCLAGAWKSVRHDLGEVLLTLDRGRRAGARDTAGDIGTANKGSQEFRRASPLEVAHANVERVQQALRSLEEFGKVVDPLFAANVERLRYRVYDVAKASETRQQACERLAGRRLYVLFDGGKSVADFEARARMILAAGVDVVQLRDKRLTDRELLDRARRLRRLTKETDTLFVMNDRSDLAVLADADGVHVGQEELTVAEARRIVGAERLIGVSTHDAAQLERAVLDGADYVGCGPTFPSTTKSFREFPGLAYLREASRRAKLPAFAIGGIHAGNVGDVLATGFERIAVAGAVWEADDPAAAVKALRESLAEPKR